MPEAAATTQQAQPQIQQPTVLVDPFAIGQTRVQPRLPDGTFAPSNAGQQPAQQQATPKPTHPDWLIEQAYLLGVPDEDMNAMSSDALGRTVRHLFRATQTRSQENGRARALDSMPSSAPPAQNYPPATYTPRDVQQPQGPTDIFAGFREDEVHPSITGVLRAMHAEILRLKGFERAFVDDKQERHTRQLQNNTSLIDDAFDALVEKLGPEGAAYYGQGPSNRLNPQSDQFLHRMNALNSGGVDVVNINAGRVHAQVERGHRRNFPLTRGAAPPQAAAQPTPQYNPYAAAAGLAPVDPQQPGRQVFTPEQWDQGGLMQPTARQDLPIPEGTDKAVQNLTARMQQSRQQQSISSLGMFSG